MKQPNLSKQESDNADEFSTLFSKLSHEDQSQKVRDFMLARLGATAKILSVISE